MKFFKNLILIFSTLFFVTAMAAKPYWNDEPPAVKKVPGLDAEQMDQLFTNLAEVTSPTVVNIFSTSKVQGGGRQMRGMDPDDFFNFFFGNPFDMPFGQPMERESKALGSGFVINNEGYIVTNSHVVRPIGRNADDVRVKFIGEKRGEGLAAKIIGVDPSTDVALLKLKTNTKTLKVASLGNSDDIKVGNWVIAIGNPYGHAHSVTQGIVSALGRNIPDINAEFIQTSASINPGNSGGPLINLKGQVVGINTAIDPRAQGIGFAIPINAAKNVIRQLIEKGEVSRGWLGVAIVDLTPQVAKELKVDAPEGALVQHVQKGEPADKAGIKVYDVITEVNGKQLGAASELITYISQVPIGQKAKLRVFRDGKPIEILVTVEQRPTDNKIARNDQDQDENEAPSRPGPGADLAGKTGMVLVELNEQMRRKANVPPGTKGVMVQHILPYSLAYQAQLRPGDVISEINRKAVSNVKTAEKEIDLSLKKEKRLLLRVVRNQESRIVLLDLSDR